jgi:hypothetical protein
MTRENDVKRSFGTGIIFVKMTKDRTGFDDQLDRARPSPRLDLRDNGPGAHRELMGLKECQPQ